MSDALTGGFLLIVFGGILLFWWARKPRADRERVFGGLIGG